MENFQQIFFLDQQHPAAKANNDISPSGGEKLLRLLSNAKEDFATSEVKANDNSVAAFFAQVSQGNAGKKVW